ncbi:MAG: VWA domain-containing protein [Acidobacteriia bacterium]|nr:VWA domain-containing protein [Terriglobia bacterium]
MPACCRAFSFRGLALLCVLTFAGGAWAQSDIDEVHLTRREGSAVVAKVNPGVDSALNTYTKPIRKNVDLVLVPVTITDALNRLVLGLQKDNFQVLEGKKPQAIEHFSSEDAPVSVGILLDTSGSMANKMDRAREAVTKFCNDANPQDEFFMITFSDEPRLVEDFTPRTEELESKLMGAQVDGQTSLLDAIYMGITWMRDARYSRKALLIISDGGDNHSRYTEAEVKSSIKEADVVIYAVGIYDRYFPTEEERLGPELLSDIAELTGGQAFTLDNPNDLPAVVSRVGVALRNQYVLAYHPENSQHDGKWHKIKIKLKLPTRLAFLHVHAKAGYYAASE